MRIQKFLRESGIGSLRYCDNLLQKKQVKVNNNIIETPTYFLKENDEITFVANQKKIFFKEKNNSDKKKKITFLFHKPKNVLSSHKDDFGRKTVIEIVKKKVKFCSPLFFAGRLDYDAHGLMFFSNDGNLINQISHPSYGWQKKYIVTSQRKIDFQKINNFSKNGCSFKNIFYSPFEYKKISDCKIEMTLREGKKNEIKNIFLVLENKVTDLFRISIGKYQIKNLKIGEIIFV